MKPLPFFRRTLFLFSWLILYTVAGKAQEFYASQGTSGGLVKINIGTGVCSAVDYPVSSCLGIGTFASIAMLRDTFHSIDFDGNYKRFVITNGAITNCTYIAQVPVFINSLTIDADGTLYAAGGSLLCKIDAQSGVVTFLGDMPFNSGGDLAFYKGNLYMASDVGIVKVNIANPSLSTMLIPIAQGLVVGLANVAVGCNENRMYAQNNLGSSTEIIQLNMEAASIAAVVCTVPYYLTDAASPVESGIFAGVTIQSMNVWPECTNKPASASIQVNTVANTTQYTYLLNNTVSNNSGLFTGLTPGNYSIHISSAGGCSLDTSLVVPVADTPHVQVQSANSFCTTPNGSLTVTATSLAPPLSYSLNQGAGQSSGSFTGLAAGNYFLQVTDSNRCTSQKIVTVQPNVPLLARQVSITAANCASNDGAINITSAAVTPTYSINNGVAQNSGQFANLVAGSYLVSTFTTQGCRYDTMVTISSIIPPIALNVNITHAVCHLNNAAVMVAATPDVQAYSINNGVRQATGQFTKLAAGSHLVSVFTSLGCRKDTTITIEDYARPAPAIQIGTSVPDCYNHSNGSITILATGPNAPFTYRLANGAFSALTTFGNLQSTTYQLSVRDSGGCVYDTVATIPNYVLVKPVASYQTTDPVCVTPQSGTVQLNVTGSGAPYQIAYQNKLYPANHLFDRLSYGDHLFLIEDRYKCVVDSALVPLTLIQLDICDTVYVPTAFTPNQDGRNDVFKATAYGILLQFTLSVYNRFGQLVFQTSDVNKSWDGKVNGFSQPAGVYVWMMKYAFGSRPPRQQQGTIVLIR